MPPIPNIISDLSTTASLNSPAGSENLSTTDDYLRAVQGIVKTVYNDQVTTNGTKANLTANTFTGNQTLASGAALNTSISTVASSATPDIWTGTSNIINYTGAVTATGFAAAPQAGVARTLILAAAASFTAGTNMLIDGVVSFTGAAGDEVTVFAVTPTQFRLRPKLSSGTAVIAGLVSNGYATYGVNTTLTQADVGRACYFGNSSTATLPLLSATPIGGIISISCPNTAVVTINASGTDKIYGAGQQNAASISISNSDSIMLVNSGGLWVQLAGTGGLGYGQTWQSVSRTSGTTYFNTTGKPITVNTYITQSAVNSTSSFTISVNGVVCVSNQISGGPSSGVNLTACVVVPIGQSYVITVIPGSGLGAITATYELR